MYLFSIMPLTLISLMKNNKLGFANSQFTTFSSRKVIFIVIVTHSLLFYYFLSIVYPPLIYVLKGYIVMNILFLLNILFLILNIFNKDKLSNLHILLLVSFIFTSLYGYFYHIGIWSRIDVVNLIGFTESIFDSSHSAIEHFKASLNYSISILVAEDYYFYHLLMLHGIPNLLHPETLSAKDLIGVNYTIIYTLNISDKLYHVVNIFPLIYQLIPNYSNNSLIAIIKGKVINHSDAVYVLSNVTYGGLIMGSNLIRISNYPIVECIDRCKVYNLNDNIHIIVGNKMHISNNLQLYGYNNFYNVIVIFMLLIIVSITSTNLGSIVKRND